MTWTVAKDSGAVSFSHWLGDASEGTIIGRMGTAEGALAVSGGHAVGGEQDGKRFEVFPGQSKFLYDDLFYHMPMMVHVTDGDGILLSCNKNTIDTLGFAEEELIGKHCLDLVTSESRDKLQREILPRFFETGFFSNVEIKFLRKSGQTVDVLMSAIGYKNADGRIERAVAVFADMTEHSRTQAALRQSEQRFRNSFEAAAHGMMILTVDGRIAAVNGAMTEMLGKSEFDLLSSSFMDIVSGDDLPKVQDLVSRIRAGSGDGVNAEIAYSGADDKILNALTSISAVRDSYGKVDQFIVQAVDITGRQRAEEHLRQAQKMEAVGQLTGGIAHDFNNLLTVVIGNLQLVESALKGNDKAQKRAKEAIDAATKGSELTKQLLAFARRQSLTPQELKVNQLIEGMAGLLQRSVGEAVELRVDLMDGDPMVEADPTQLETSILNLAINARDAMTKGGRLTIETSSEYLDADYARDHEEVTPGHYLMIAVSDTGSGIPKHLLHKVFQPFFTTKEVGKGTGLGLSMVFGYIKQSGGHVKVYSEEGRGTSIKLYLPRKFADGELAAEGTGKSKQKEERKGKILVVEDQENVRDVAVEFLEEFGYEVVQAGDAVEALQVLQDHPDVDLLFTDVVMPGGMNGFDLSQAAEQIRPDLKVVHASGYPKGAMVHQEEPRLKDNLISKPYQREELQRVIEQTLKGEGAIELDAQDRVLAAGGGQS